MIIFILKKGGDMKPQSAQRNTLCSPEKFPLKREIIYEIALSRNIGTCKDNKIAVFCYCDANISTEVISFLDFCNWLRYRCREIKRWNKKTNNLRSQRGRNQKLFNSLLFNDFSVFSVVK
jgi:hypothetical protein